MMMVAVPNGGLADKQGTTPLEVTLPLVASRVE
jgi:hypothetical protein